MYDPFPPFLWWSTVRWNRELPANHWAKEEKTIMFPWIKKEKTQKDFPLNYFSVNIQLYLVISIMGGIFMYLSFLIISRWKSSYGLTFWSNELLSGPTSYWSGYLHSGGHYWAVDWLARASHLSQLECLQWFSLLTVL